MTIKEQIDYWVKIAENDLPAAEHLFENKHYIWCLFIGHLILEKIIKAHYVKDIGKTPPKIHDLVKLSDRTKLNLANEQKEFLDKVNDFNIEARYPDYKYYAQKRLTENSLKKIFKRLRRCING